MGQTNSEIPQEIAIQLCDEIRRQYTGKWWTLAGLQCMGCVAATAAVAATKGDMSKMCFSNAPSCRGCNLVNARYERLVSKN
jgi:hypothetical protein